jgi:hypothetical protein
VKEKLSEKLFYIGNFGETVENSDDKYIKEAEMFSTGVHRGVEYTEDDINQLVETFSAEDDVPVQIDHSESALHTVGYLREAFSKGGKLMGKLEILDKAIQERIDMGLMKKLSVSFYLKHTEEGFKPHKLREVSLVAFPQVKGARLFSENGYVSDYTEQGGNEMGAENKNQEQFSEEVLNKAKEMLEEDLVEKYNALEEKLEKLVKDNEKFSKQEISHKVEKFQEEKKVVPAQAEALEKLLGSFSEEQAQLFEEFMKNNKTVDLSEQGQFEEQDGEKDNDKRSDEQKEFDAFYEEHAKKYGVSL